MAKLFVCSLRDSKMDGAFARPMFYPTTAFAVRQVADEVNRDAEDNPLSRHAEDYELWMLCMYDEATGLFYEDKDSPRRMLACASDLKRS